MEFLNLWIFTSFIPLFFIYKKHIKNTTQRNVKLLFFALIFMILAVARPVHTNSYIDKKVNSQDIIIALDASYSMQADDLKPSRYIMAKQTIKKLLSMRPKDRFTLFIFTSNALLISPPTTDHTLSFIALDTINPEYILTKSTSLKALLLTIAKLPLQTKKLLIFSDGGDEHNINTLAQIVKENNITPYFIATATHRGAALKKNAHYIKDAHSSLVISKINPSLKDLAKEANGYYYELTSLNIAEQVDADLVQEQKNQTSVTIKSYQELYYIPLFIALFLFFLSITKFGLLFVFMVSLFIAPPKTEAFIFDFYHLHQAEEALHSHHYKQAIKEYRSLTPSVQSYYNIASLYYKLGEYRDALSYYTKIETTNQKLKAAIFYNMGNCALKIKKYERAKRFYRLALAFKADKDAIFNLNLVKKLHKKKAKDVVDMMPKEQRHKAAKEHQKTSKEEKNSNNASARSDSNQQSDESSHGGGSGKKKKQKAIKRSQTKNKSSKYKLGYKAYEKINKGYSNEKEPW